MREIVLASASPRRCELLKQIGVSFKVIPSNVEENISIDLSPEELAQNLAYEKALSVAKKLENDSIVIGADTIVVKNGVLGKPLNENQAFDMLSSLQGDWHEVITGIAVIEVPGLRYLKGFEKTRVRMRNVSDDAIKAYIKTGEPMDKAGAYGIQGMGAVFIERIEGCYFNVVGLPLMKLAVMLEEFGIRVL